MTLRFLTATEVAKSLQVNVETVYALIANDNLPAVKVGGQWRFDENEFRAWINRKSINKPASEPSMTRVEK
jgi:excisionase family DNA binding protein